MCERRGGWEEKVGTRKSSHSTVMFMSDGAPNGVGYRRQVRDDGGGVEDEIDADSKSGSEIAVLTGAGVYERCR